MTTARFDPGATPPATAAAKARGTKVAGIRKDIAALQKRILACDTVPLPADALARLQLIADIERKKAELNLAALQAHYNRTVRIHG